MTALTEETPRSRDLFADAGPVSHHDAAEAARRLINSHFNNPDQARVSIPVRGTDDDIVITRYIKQQAALSAAWRPIADAPKDGTRIWLADEKGNLVTGYWSPPVGAWRCDWVVGQVGDKPTLWQPLPLPPTVQPESGERT